MNCPFCAHEDTKVLESRLADDALRRRRECLKCSTRFTTYERASFNLTVQKKDGSIQPFSSEKMLLSVQRALGKASDEKVTQIARTVEQRVLRSKKTPIKTSYIGTIVMRELKRVDTMAYMRFASIYKDINDPTLLKKELGMITKG